jgi:hypothetical protein
MRVLATVIAASQLLLCSAFVAPGVRTQPLRARAVAMSVFDDTTLAFSKAHPEIYAVCAQTCLHVFVSCLTHVQAGVGPTTKAERWNGRHAMFGWVALLATAYVKSHGLIPNADVPLAFEARWLCVYGVATLSGTWLRTGLGRPCHHERRGT